MLQCAPSICGGSNQASRGAEQAGYDLAGHLISSYDGASGSISYGRSPAGELTSMTQNTYTNAQNTPNLVSSVANSPFGPSSYTLGNGLGMAKTYDTLGRNAGVWVCSGSTSPYCTNATQLYGNTTSFSGTRATDMCDTVINQCQGQGYDEFNRLTTVSGANNKYGYSYDRYGNRLTQTSSPSGPAPSYSFNDANQIVGLPYDAAGNLMGDGISHSFTYDAEGNEMSVDNGSTATYVYDALNRRVSSKTSSGTTEYVYNAQGQRTSSWLVNGSAAGFGNEGRIYWDGQQFAYRAQDGTTYFQHKSPLGTDRVRTNYQGVAIDERSLAFGDAFSSDSSNAQGAAQDNDQYAGLEHDAESFSEHATFRQYSSTQGRWMSPDPYDGSYSFLDPQSFNRYVYVENNPYTFTDPAGLQRPQSCTDTDTCPGGGGGLTVITGQGSSFGSGWDEFGSLVTIDTPEAGTVYSGTSSWENAVNDDNYNTASGGTIYSQNGEASGTYSTTFFGLLGAGSFGFGTSGFGSPSISSAPSNRQQTPDPFQKRLFGTHYCGPGGAGPTLNALDSACQAHDQCYDTHNLSVGSNFNPFAPASQIQALQACNQQLCNASSGLSDLGATRVSLYFQTVPIVGACHNVMTLP